MLKLQSHYSLILTTVVLAWQPTKDQASRRANNAVLNISGGDRLRSNSIMLAISKNTTHKSQLRGKRKISAAKGWGKVTLDRCFSCNIFVVNVAHRY